MVMCTEQDLDLANIELAKRKGENHEVNIEWTNLHNVATNLIYTCTDTWTGYGWLCYELNLNRRCKHD